VDVSKICSLRIRSFLQRRAACSGSHRFRRDSETVLSKVDRINTFNDADEYGLGIWRRADESHSTRENVPARIFKGVTEIAVRLAQSGPNAARRVMTLLEERPEKIFTKLRYGILANAGDRLTEKLDDIIASDEAINPPYFLREIPELVRKQFGNASPLARRISATASREVQT
jgi:hypothetical protein